MAQTYKFMVSMPVIDTLPRNRATNVLHFEHVTGGVVATDLQQMCSDIADMWQTRYGNQTREVNVKAYDVGPVPNYPLASVTVDAGVPWPCTHPLELALCLSFAGSNRGNKRERGRIYLMPQLSSLVPSPDSTRPALATQQWALDFYTVSNGSLPDIGGPDWKFGIWSRVGQHFTQAQQAWVNDDWDSQRKRSLRENSRISATREG